MFTMFTQKEPKESNIFFCNICNFVCSKKSNYNKHLNTRKHDNVYKYLQNNTKKCSQNAATNNRIWIMQTILRMATSVREQNACRLLIVKRQTKSLKRTGLNKKIKLLSKNSTNPKPSIMQQPILMFYKITRAVGFFEGASTP